jgi:hypothetical protein
MFAFGKIFRKITYTDSENSFKNAIDTRTRVAGVTQVSVELKQIAFRLELLCVYVGWV